MTLVRQAGAEGDERERDRTSLFAIALVTEAGLLWLMACLLLLRRRLTLTRLSGANGDATGDEAWDEAGDEAFEGPLDPDDRIDE